MRQRLESVVRDHGVAGAVAGISVSGSRAFAATGVAPDAGDRMTPLTRVHVASVTKPIVAASFLATAAEALDRPVLELVPELAEHWRVDRRITPRDLLSHTSGLHPDLNPAPPTLLEAVRAVVGHRPSFARRWAWEYCNGGFWLTGLALSRLRGTTFERAMELATFGPLGMRDSRFDSPVYPPGRKPGGGLVSTVGDLLNFADHVMVTPDLIKCMTKPVSATTNGSWYGLGWELADRTGSVIWHRGRSADHHSMLLLVPKEHLAIAMVCHGDNGAKAVGDFVAAELARTTGRKQPWRMTKTAPLLAYAYTRYGVARMAARFAR